MTLNNTVDVDGQLLELVWNNTNDAIFTIGYDGHILEVNPAFISILGWDKKKKLNALLRLIVKLKESYPINHYEFSVTTSIGVSIFPKDGDNVKTLMRKADQALYTAKDKRDSYALYK